jgi:hypothetical protein
MTTSKKAPAAAKPMKRSNYYVPEAFKAGLRKVAKVKGGTEADHLRKAVELYLRRHKALA